MTSGCELYFPPGCRARFAQTSPAGGAAVRLSGLSHIGIRMAAGAELLMDNLSGGSGTSHGISVTGAGDDIRLDGVRVRWATQPGTRSTGDVIRFLGYPSEGAPAAGWTASTGTISNVQLTDCTAVSAPQCGAIFMGASDVRVSNFRVENTMADALHVNACRRVNIAGHTAVGSGDDGLAFVTYFHATDIWQGANGPFNQPSLGGWSNANSVASGIVVQGGTGNGCRISGGLDVTVSGLSVTGKTNSGLAVDSAIANGSTVNWTYHASRGVAVQNITVQDTPIGIWIPAQNVDSADDQAFWTFDARIVGATLRGCSNYAVRTQGDGSTASVVAGVHLADIKVTTGSGGGGNGAVALSSLRDSTVANIVMATSNGAQLAVLGQDSAHTGALSVLPRHNVALSNLVNRGGKILIQDVNGLTADMLCSRNSATDGVQLIRVRNADIDGVTVAHANRANSGTVRAVHFQKVLHVNVGSVTVEHDANNATTWRAMEIGGGDATDVAANNLRIARFSYINTLNQTGSDITVQGSTFAPINYAYTGAHYNAGEASPTWRAVTAGTLP